MPRSYTFACSSSWQSCLSACHSDVWWSLSNNSKLAEVSAMTLRYVKPHCLTPFGSMDAFKLDRLFAGYPGPMKQSDPLSLGAAGAFVDGHSLLLFGHAMHLRTGKARCFLPHLLAAIISAAMARTFRHGFAHFARSRLERFTPGLINRPGTHGMTIGKPLG